jgi:Ion channel
VFSFYWAITTIATVGYGDFHAASMPEAIFNLVFMLFTIGAPGRWRSAHITTHS